MEWVQRALDYVESLGYEVAHISLYGSQNYKLDTKDSDLDYKCVIIPTLDQLVSNSQPVSTTYDFEWGKIDLKDIRVFMETLSKCNPAYLETMFSKFSLTPCNTFNSIRELTPKLITERASLLARASCGMAMEKFNALCHPYPSIKDKIDKYGYDPKQLHHIWRLRLIIEKFNRTGQFELVPSERWINTLIGMKTNPMDLENAKDSAELGMKQCLLFRDIIIEKYPIVSNTTKDEMQRLSQEIIKKSIINNINNEY